MVILTQLPTEILLNISSHLALLPLSSLTRTCHLLHRTLSSGLYPLGAKDLNDIPLRWAIVLHNLTAVSQLLRFSRIEAVPLLEAATWSDSVPVLQTVLDHVAINTDEDLPTILNSTYKGSADSVFGERLPDTPDQGPILGHARSAEIARVLLAAGARASGVAMGRRGGGVLWMCVYNIGRGPMVGCGEQAAELVRLLLAEGAAAEMKITFWGEPLLYAAVRGQCLPVVKVLVEAGATADPWTMQHLRRLNPMHFGDCFKWIMEWLGETKRLKFYWQVVHCNRFLLARWLSTVFEDLREAPTPPSTWIPAIDYEYEMGYTLSSF